jgi:hypothetical protein
MSQPLFIHDFFQDGRADVTSEIRKLQVYGDWTKEKRASFLKQAKACFERSKYTHPNMPQAGSYYAGRLAGLRSALTAQYPKLEPNASMIFLPIPVVMRCSECGEKASWERYPEGNASLVTFLCDRCKQEWVRDAIVDDGRGDECENELLRTATIGLALLDLMLHVPTHSFFFQIWFVLSITFPWQEFFESERVER